MKVTICDPCKTFDKTTVETNQYLRVKGKPHLRLDVCPTHNTEVAKLNMVDYARFVYKCNGIDLDDKSDLEVKQLVMA